jgi:hypothetical protein
MENDSIRARGSDTLVDIWIAGKVRAICVTQEAIGAYLDFERAAAMSDDERCGFVRDNLSTVHSAAKARLRDGDSDADAIDIDAGHLARPDGLTSSDRRSDRRKSDRRKSNRPLGSQPERRRSDRRKGDRRARPPKKDS